MAINYNQSDGDIDFNDTYDNDDAIDFNEINENSAPAYLETFWSQIDEDVIEPEPEPVASTKPVASAVDVMAVRDEALSGKLGVGAAVLRIGMTAEKSDALKEKWERYTQGKLPKRDFISGVNGIRHAEIIQELVDRLTPAAVMRGFDRA